MNVLRRTLIITGILLAGSGSIAYFYLGQNGSNVEGPAPKIKSLAGPRDESNQMAQKIEKKAKEARAVKSKLQEVKQQIQTNAELAEASAEYLHYTPKLILDAAAKLAEVIELESAHPELKSEFEVFYVNCAHDSAIITVTRAQCLKRFVDLAHPGSQEEQQLLSELPASVVHLYQSL